MFVPVQFRYRQLLWYDVKRYLSVFHFSVLAFVKAHLMVLPFEMA